MKKYFPTYEEAQRLIQEKGVKSASEYMKNYKELGLPSSPHLSYLDSWSDWDTFLGKEKISYPTYEEARMVVQENGIKSIEQYKSLYKELGLPLHPDRHFQDWENWLDFFGKACEDYPTYEEAKEIVKKNGIPDSKGYKSSYKRLHLPAHPDRYYKNDGWIDWYDFLGKNIVIYPTYNEAVQIVQEKGIQSQIDYMKVLKETGLPSNPHLTYKDSGWIDWYHFLGKSRKVSPEERKYRILTKLSLSPILLQEDAPLQVLYILASELDKRLAREMEELLGVTTFEERLNWVKEQLKNLKEGSTSICKTTDVTPSDELSAMKSLLEEFDLTDKISFTLENYLHSAINRELISEYDG